MTSENAMSTDVIERCVRCGGDVENPEGISEDHRKCTDCGKWYHRNPRNRDTGIERWECDRCGGLNDSRWSECTHCRGGKGKGGERRVCPDCDREVVVTQRVVDRCGYMDVLCPDCGCAFEPESWSVDTGMERGEGQ